jgi:hypothetical protein
MVSGAARCDARARGCEGAARCAVDSAANDSRSAPIRGPRDARAREEAPPEAAAPVPDGTARGPSCGWSGVETRGEIVSGESAMTGEFQVRQFVLRSVMWVNYHQDKGR